MVKASFIVFWQDCEKINTETKLDIVKIALKESNNLITKAI